MELLGAEIILHLDLGGKEVVARMPARNMYKPGDKVKMVLNTNYMHVFDPMTELAIL